MTIFRPILCLPWCSTSKVHLRSIFVTTEGRGLITSALFWRIFGQIGPYCTTLPSVTPPPYPRNKICMEGAPNPVLCAPSSNWMHLWVLLCFYLIGKRNLGGISGVLGPPSRLTAKITEGSRGQKKVFFSTEYKQFLACIYIKGPLCIHETPLITKIEFNLSSGEQFE